MTFMNLEWYVNMCKVICFSGQQRNGKDESADYLVNKLNEWHRASFAGDVKATFCEMFNVDLAFVEKWKTNPEPPPGFIMNVRDSLIFIGDGFRQIQPDIWVERCFKKSKYPMIISDGRYISELKKVRELEGINVLIYREGYLNDIKNASESQIRPIVEFYIESGIEEATATYINNYKGNNPNYENAKLIDYFIKNDSDLNSLYNKIDESLVPFIQRKVIRCQD